jgi:ssDNA-binding Zn-finger/Zn-ribbon topoisomerase 1
LITDFKKPVKCPKCHKKLNIFQAKKTKILEWTIDEDDKKDEGRFEDNGQGFTEIFCYNCGAKIGHYEVNTEWGMFPDQSVMNA